jgi:hypothetical protein
MSFRLCASGGVHARLEISFMEIRHGIKRADFYKAESGLASSCCPRYIRVFNRLIEVTQLIDFARGVS